MKTWLFMNAAGFGDEIAKLCDAGVFTGNSRDSDYRNDFNLSMQALSEALIHGTNIKDFSVRCSASQDNPPELKNCSTNEAWQFLTSQFGTEGNFHTPYAEYYLQKIRAAWNNEFITENTYKAFKIAFMNNAENRFEQISDFCYPRKNQELNNNRTSLMAMIKVIATENQVEILNTTVENFKQKIRQQPDLLTDSFKERSFTTSILLSLIYEIRQTVYKNPRNNEALIDLTTDILENYSDSIPASFRDDDGNTVIQRHLWNYAVFINTSAQDTSVQSKNIRVKLKSILDKLFVSARKQHALNNILSFKNNYDETFFDNLFYSTKGFHKWSKVDEGIFPQLFDSQMLGVAPDPYCLTSYEMKLNDIIDLVTCPILAKYLDDPWINLVSGYSYSYYNPSEQSDPLTKGPLNRIKNPILAEITKRLMLTLKSEEKNIEEKYRDCIAQIEAYHKDLKPSTTAEALILMNDRAYLKLLGHVNYYNANKPSNENTNAVEQNQTAATHPPVEVAPQPVTSEEIKVIPEIPESNPDAVFIKRAKLILQNLGLTKVIIRPRMENFKKDDPEHNKKQALNEIQFEFVTEEEQVSLKAYFEQHAPQDITWCGRGYANQLILHILTDYFKNEPILQENLPPPIDDQENLHPIHNPENPPRIVQENLPAVAEGISPLVASPPTTVENWLACKTEFNRLLQELRETTNSLENKAIENKKYMQVAHSMQQLVTTLTEQSAFFDAPSAASFSSFQQTCMQAIKSAEKEASNQRGWHAVHPFLRGLFGVLLGMAALPIVFIPLAFKSYSNIFFKTPQTGTEQKLNKIYTEFEKKIRPNEDAEDSPSNSSPSN